MASQQLSAKSLLHTFLDRAGKALRPTYTTSDAKNALGHFECICTLPTVYTATGSFGSQQFMGEGASRSLASAKAAEVAWAGVQGSRANEAFQAKRFKQDLWTAICSTFTPEVCLDPDVCSQIRMHPMHQPAAAEALYKDGMPSFAMLLSGPSLTG